MQLAAITKQSPQLIQALEALAQRADCNEAAHTLIDELSGITVLVARKFTNDKTADGLQEALYLTIGCISLAISQTNIQKNNELSFLLQQGAEHAFQMGFRLIKELSNLPYAAFVSDFDSDPIAKQRNIKALFFEICRAEPNSAWTGDQAYQKELLVRNSNRDIIECAKWLRKKHYAGSVKDNDLDANAVIAIAVIFAILGDGRIVARAGQKEIESLILQARAMQPDIEAGWNEFLKKVPPEYRPILLERIDAYRNTIVNKILSKIKLKTVVTEIQNYYAGSELDIDYP